MFSVTGHVTTWWRSHLKHTTISDIMVYKVELSRKAAEGAMVEVEEWEDFPIDEVEGMIPAEWEQDFWRKKLHLELVAVLDRFRGDTE